MMAPFRPADAADMRPIPSMTVTDDGTVVTNDDTVLCRRRRREASSGDKTGGDQGEQFHGIFSCVPMGTEAK
jgi:hypothetical protein